MPGEREKEESYTEARMMVVPSQAEMTRQRDVDAICHRKITSVPA